MNRSDAHPDPGENITDLEAAGESILTKLGGWLGDPIRPEQVAVGDEIGGYSLVAQVGAGGFAEVWRAIDLSTDEQVVVKLYRSKAESDWAAAEQAALHRLKGLPGIAALKHFDTWNERPFLVLDWIDGVSLAACIAEVSDEPIRRGIPILRAILTTLELIHECIDEAGRPIVHGDLKPSNVLLVEDDRPVLIDFNIAFRPASAGSDGSEQTQSLPLRPAGVSAEYRVPEVILGDATGRTADLYQVGMLAFELFTAARYTEIYKLGGTKKIREILLEAVGEPLAQAVLKATNWEPADRYSSATEMRSSIERANAASDTTTRRAAILTGAVAIAATTWRVIRRANADVEEQESARGMPLQPVESTRVSGDPGEDFQAIVQLCNQYRDLKPVRGMPPREATRSKAEQLKRCILACNDWTATHVDAPHLAERIPKMLAWLKRAAEPHEVFWELKPNPPLRQDVEIVLRQGDRVTHRRPLSVEHEILFDTWPWDAMLRLHEFVSFEVLDSQGGILAAIPWALLQGISDPPKRDRLSCHLQSDAIVVDISARAFPQLRPQPFPIRRSV